MVVSLLGVHVKLLQNKNHSSNFISSENNFAFSGKISSFVTKFSFLLKTQRYSILLGGRIFCKFPLNKIKGL
jgi:hypothetical protein